MNRIRAAFAALLGRPVIANVIFDGGFRYATDNSPGGVIVGNTTRP